MIRKISYLGLGTMGSGIASNLLKSGYQLTVWNRSTEKCKPFARKGARVAKTPADAVRGTDLVMYSLSDGDAVEKVVFGTEGILTGNGQMQSRPATAITTIVRQGNLFMSLNRIKPITLPQ